MSKFNTRVFEAITSYTGMAHDMARDIAAEIQANRVTHKEFLMLCETLRGIHLSLAKGFAKLSAGEEEGHEEHRGA